MIPAEIQQTKQRFGIIGNAPGLIRAITRALQIAPIDLAVLITGESGAGKEFFPQIIHANSSRKHGKYIAVNCGAIPEGTIDSELFGHEKELLLAHYLHERLFRRSRRRNNFLGRSRRITPHDSGSIIARTRKRRISKSRFFHCFENQCKNRRCDQLEHGKSRFGRKIQGRFVLQAQHDTHRNSPIERTV